MLGKSAFYLVRMREPNLPIDPEKAGKPAVKQFLETRVGNQAAASPFTNKPPLWLVGTNIAKLLL